jgi:hypothetical protein
VVESVPAERVTPPRGSGPRKMMMRGKKLQKPFSKMRLIILPDPDTVASWVATYVKKRILAFAPTPERPFILGTSLRAQI